MKKALLVILAGFIFVAFAQTVNAKDYMYGMKYLTFKWTGVDLDHTYHCAYIGSTRYCWSWTGGQSGGSYISYSGGYGDGTDAKCTSTNLTCRFVYGVQGVCHQEANRGLYTSGKTVYKAKGYWLSSSLFGTYGGGWTACKSGPCWLWW